MFDLHFLRRPSAGGAAEQAFRLGWWRPATLVLALILLGKSGQAADWSCSFEADEGFLSNQSAAGAVVTVVGGTAVVTSTDAAEGQQFIRFSPQLPDNALVLVMSRNSAVVRERIVRFALRMTGDSAKARLVLLGGQTVALRPAAGAIAIEVGDLAPQRFTVPSPDGGWLRIAIDEHPSARTWDLSVGETVLARALPLQPSSAISSSQLIFADGSLDLDAIRVTVTDEADAGAVADSAATAENAAPAAGQTGLGSNPQTRRNQALAQSLQSARAGDLASAESLLSAESAELPYTAAWHLDMATMLLSMAFDLHDDGHYALSIALGRAVLRHLREADLKFSAAELERVSTASPFMAAQINHYILNDVVEAQRQYQRVLTIDANHVGAKEALDLIGRQFRISGGQNSVATGGRR